MPTTIKEHVTVGAGGKIELRSAQLHEGDLAEVTVVVEQQAEATPAERLAAFKRLTISLNLTEEKAQAWIDEIHDERRASTDRLDRR